MKMNRILIGEVERMKQFFYPKTNVGKPGESLFAFFRTPGFLATAALFSAAAVGTLIGTVWVAVQYFCETDPEPLPLLILLGCAIAFVQLVLAAVGIWTVARGGFRRSAHLVRCGCTVLQFAAAISLLLVAGTVGAVLYYTQPAAWLVVVIIVTLIVVFHALLISILGKVRRNLRRAEQSDRSLRRCSVDGIYVELFLGLVAVLEFRSALSVSLTWFSGIMLLAALMHFFVAMLIARYDELIKAICLKEQENAT